MLKKELVEIAKSKNSTAPFSTVCFLVAVLTEVACFFSGCFKIVVGVFLVNG